MIQVKQIIFLLLLVAPPFSSNTFSQGSLTEENEFGENPGDLKAFVYSPEFQSNVDKKRPLVLALHGCSQTSNGLAEITGWNQLADEHGFVVLYPNQRLKNNPSNCFNWFELEDIEGKSGELQSIMNILNYTIDSYNIDTAQIYIYGVSAGAAMGVCLMANYPSYFKCGAIFAGAPFKVAVNKKQAVKAMLKTIDKSPMEWGKLVSKDSTINFPRLIVYHGTSDKTVHVKNSYELIEQWSYLFDIDTIPDSVISNYQAANVDRMAYTDSSGTEKIVFYKFFDLGHAIPVDPGTGKMQGGKTGIFAADVDFFSTYYVAKEFGLIKE